MVWGFIFKGGKWVMKTRKAAKKKKTSKPRPGRGSVEIKPRAGWSKTKPKTLKQKIQEKRGKK